MMTNVMNEELNYYQHVKVRAFADMGLEYDILGGHQRMQSAYGSKNKHYTQLTTGIVMRKPRIPVVSAGDYHLVLKINPSGGNEIADLWGVPLGTTVAKTESAEGTETLFVQGRNIRYWVDKAYINMMHIVDITKTLVDDMRQVNNDDERFEAQFPGARDRMEELHTFVQDPFYLLPPSWSFELEFQPQLGDRTLVDAQQEYPESPWS